MACCEVCGSDVTELSYTFVDGYYVCLVCLPGDNASSTVLATPSRPPGSELSKCNCAGQSRR